MTKPKFCYLKKPPLNLVHGDLVVQSMYYVVLESNIFFVIWTANSIKECHQCFQRELYMTTQVLSCIIDILQLCQIQNPNNWSNNITYTRVAVLSLKLTRLYNTLKVFYLSLLWKWSTKSKGDIDQSVYLQFIPHPWVFLLLTGQICVQNQNIYFCEDNTSLHMSKYNAAECLHNGFSKICLLSTCLDLNAIEQFGIISNAK